MVHISHQYMTTGKTIALTTQIFVSKVLSLVFNTLSSLVIAFFPRRIFILWLQSPSAVILKSNKIKSVTVSTFPPYICHEVMGPDAMIFVFWMLSLSQLFHSPLSPSSRGSLVPLHFLPLKWYHLHIWHCWYFSQQSGLQLTSHSTQHLTWCTLHIRVKIHSLDVLLSQFEPVHYSMSSNLFA